MGAERAIAHLRPPLRPIGPDFSPAVLALVHGLLPLLLRVRLFPWLPAGIGGIEVVGGDTLARCFHRFGRGEIRLILAFRHCEVDDPLCGLHLLSRTLPRRATALGLEIPRPCHVHFLFDRGMPLWAGRPLGWVLSRLGGVSLHRGRHPDWTALRQARHLVLNGRFPFAVAPEGATNGHGEAIGPLEPGVAQLGLWCLEDLRRDGRGEEVLILPIGLQYRYEEAQWWRLERLMGELERAIGMAPPRPALPERLVPAGVWDSSDAAQVFYPRLLRLGEALLERLESFYNRYALSQQPATTPSATTSASPAPSSFTYGIASDELGQRIESLVERALTVAEAQLGVRPAGTPGDRCRRLEEAAWRWIHRDDLAPPAHPSPLERGLAERTAHEAVLAETHMRLAESFLGVSGAYVAERPSFERFMETCLLIHDGLARLRGDALPGRPRLGLRRARFTVGTPLSVDACCAGLIAAEGNQTGWHPPGRAESRAVIQRLTAAILRSFEDGLI